MGRFFKNNLNPFLTFLECSLFFSSSLKRSPPYFFRPALRSKSENKVRIRFQVQQIKMGSESIVGIYVCPQSRASPPSSPLSAVQLERRSCRVAVVAGCVPDRVEPGRLADPAADRETGVDQVEMDTSADRAAGREIEVDQVADRGIGVGLVVGTVADMVVDIPGLAAGTGAGRCDTELGLVGVPFSFRLSWP